MAALVLCVSCATSGREYAGVHVASGPGHRTLNNAELVRQSDDAVAVVHTDVGRGLAFVIDPAGYLITNRHVVEDAEFIERVTFPAYDPPLVFKSVQVVYTDPDRDLALLRVHAPNPLPSLPLAAKADVPVTRYLRHDDPVIVLRREEENNGDVHFSVNNTEVTDLAVYNSGVGSSTFVAVGADVARGQSGGPVLDKFGRVVAVVTWTWRDRVGGYAIPISDVMRMLEDRPTLDSDAQHQDRATERSRDFLAALGRGDVDDARRLTSPSHARQLRGEAVETILALVSDGGFPVLQGFLGAVESLVDLPPQRQSERLRSIVGRTATTDFREALGIDEDVLGPQVVSFFFELGQAYLVARAVGGQSASEALETAMLRLQTIDAARTFALAGLLDGLAGSAVEIERVRVVPGAYGRKAVVELRTTSTVLVAGNGPMATGTALAHPSREHLTLHMKLEWGDWYVANVGKTPLAEPSVAG